MSSGLGFRCVKSCPKVFGSQRGLTKHQSSCSVFTRVTGEELLEALEREESANKRQRLGFNDYLDIDSCFQNPSAKNASEPTAMDTDTEHAPHQHPAVPSPVASILENNEVLVNEEEGLGRGKRKRWRTKRYQDPRPEPPAPLPEPTFTPNEPCTTARNANNVWRVYVSRPTYVPDECDVETTRFSGNIGDDAIASASEALHEHSLLSGVTQDYTTQEPWFTPFLNVSTFRLMNWFWTGSQNKSISDLQSLADTVLKAEDFATEDFSSFNARAENRRLDKWADECTSAECAVVSDNWLEASVTITLPTRSKHASESDMPVFTVPGLLYRPIVEVVKRAFQVKEALRYHYIPFQQFWKRNNDEVQQRVYDELYTGDAWLKAHADLQQLPRDKEDTYERVVAALMLWSDSTHLANFGNASLWPLYLFMGNLSKQERSQPGSNACHHIAYFPMLPDSISDALKQRAGGKRPTKETLTHCKRDLMHALLSVIFGDDFMLASKEGLVIRCADGITRRIFPRIMTYSADYPEKVLLSSIRFLSAYPCPRCLIKKTEAPNLGSTRNETVLQTQLRQDSKDRQESIAYSRNLIYKEGRGVKCTAIEAVLASKSLVPTINTFSSIMWPLGYNFYQIFVVDLLHEVELGVWKALIVHLIRILMACGEDCILVVNERYRMISTFGRDTIRKFTSDASSLKKLAARDFEDLLICSMPAFEGLFPGDHDIIVQDLLFSLLTWHALAKLHLHTDKTLALLHDAKRRLGVMLQRFQDNTCQAYETRELPSERARRERRAARKRAANQSSERQMPEDPAEGPGTQP